MQQIKKPDAIQASVDQEVVDNAVPDPLPAQAGSAAHTTVPPPPAEWLGRWKFFLNIAQTAAVVIVTVLTVWTYRELKESVFNRGVNVAYVDWDDLDEKDASSASFQWRVSKVLLDLQLASNVPNAELQLGAVWYHGTVLGDTSVGDRPYHVHALKLFAQGWTIVEVDGYRRGYLDGRFVLIHKSSNTEVPDSPIAAMILTRHQRR